MNRTGEVDTGDGERRMCTGEGTGDLGKSKWRREGAE